MRPIRSLMAVVAAAALLFPTLAVPAPLAASGGFGGLAASDGASGGASAAQIGESSAGASGRSTGGAVDASPDTVHLAGTLQVTVTDDFAGGSQAFYSIETDAGTVRLDVSGKDVSRLAGARVKLTGTRRADGRVAVAAGSIEVEQPAVPPSKALAPNASGGSAQPATTTQRIAVIIGEYGDLADYPATVDEANQVFANDVPGAVSVHNYYDATSRGRLTTTTTVLGRWPLGISQCNDEPFGLFDAAINAAYAYAAAHGVNLSVYDHVLVWMRAPTDDPLTGDCAVPWVGMGSISGPYVLLAVDVETYGTAVTTIVASHELDHNLGLYHANGLACYDGSNNQVALSPDCQSKEYHDQFSTMGVAGSLVNALLDSDRLDTMGWLDPSEKQTVSSAGTYSLVPTYSSSPGVRLIRIPRPAAVVPYSTGGYWTLEIRSTLAGSGFDQFSAYPPALSATTGVTIRLSQDGAGYSAGFYSQLVDNHPTATRAEFSGLNYDAYWDAPLQPGNTFTDSAGGFTIAVDSVTGSGATVTIGDTLAPIAPPSLVATALTPSGARLDWTAASDNLALAHYRIFRDSSQIAEVSSSTLTYTDSTVTGGPHTYAVRAVDTANLESPGATAAVVTAGYPGAPTAVTAVAGNAAALVSWTAADPDGSPITGYTVTSSIGGLTCTTTGATSCVVEGLTNGTPYTFTVTATNAVGTGPASGASNAVTPAADVPGRPTAVSGVPGGASVAVTWAAPTDPGAGGPISGYTVTSSPGGNTCTTSGSIGCTVTDLANGTAYTFTVTATNSLGTGLRSDPSASVTPLTIPQAPTSVTALGTNGSATVSWHAPGFDGGSPITSYVVTATPGGATCSTTDALSCAMPGLVNRSSYTFTVVAHNVAGDGPASDASAAVMPLAGATYVAVTPNRLVDSRSGTRLGLSAPLTSGTPASFQVTGRVPSDATRNIPTGAIAVTGNLTAVNEGSNGYLSLTPTRPSGTPTTSTLNFPRGDIRANAVTVPLGSGGVLWVTFVGTAGTRADAVFDVTGYFVGNTSGATYVPLTPNRLVDSRAGTRLGLSASLTSSSPASFQVTGRVPSDATRNVPSNAIAVTGNLTAVNEGSNGYFSLTPAAPSGAPTTSTVNFPRGDIRANAVTVPLASDGKLWVTFVGTAGTRADVVLDVTGYFVPDTSGATWAPVTPNRLADSRAGTRLGLSASLTSSSPASFQVTGRVPSDATRNIPSNAIAITGNLTAVNEASRGYFSLTPAAPSGVPTTSTLNFPKGDIRANAVTAPLGPDGKLWVTFVGTAGTRADVVFDVTGYFTLG